MEKSVKILSLNVGCSHNLAGLASLVGTLNVDLVLLQEVSSTQCQFDAIVGGFGFKGEVNFDENFPSKPGTAAAWRISLPVDNVISLLSRRTQLVKIGSFVVINVYAPSGSDKRSERNIFFGQEVFEALCMFPASKPVLVGDFNCVLNQIDVENGTGFNQKFSPALKDLVTSFRLIDAFRHKFPRLQDYTFFRPGKSASRLDRFYLPSSCSDAYSISHIASLSDHCAVFLELKMDVSFFNSPKSGRNTYWKLNTSILHETEFIASFKSLWSEIIKCQNEAGDIADWWNNVAKPSIKDFCISFSKHKKAVQRDTVKFLLSCLKLVLSKKDWDEVARIKEDLRTIFLKDSIGLIIRSRYA